MRASSSRDRQAERGRELRQALLDALERPRDIRRRLGQQQLAVLVGDDDVGERPAGVDGDAKPHQSAAFTRSELSIRWSCRPASDGLRAIIGQDPVPINRMRTTLVRLGDNPAMAVIETLSWEALADKALAERLAPAAIAMVFVVARAPGQAASPIGRCWRTWSSRSRNAHCRAERSRHGDERRSERRHGRVLRSVDARGRRRADGVPDVGEHRVRLSRWRSARDAVDRRARGRARRRCRRARLLPGSDRLRTQAHGRDRGGGPGLRRVPGGGDPRLRGGGGRSPAAREAPRRALRVDRRRRRPRARGRRGGGDARPGRHPADASGGRAGRCGGRRAVRPRGLCGPRLRRERQAGAGAREAGARSGGDGREGAPARARRHGLDGRGR